MSVGDARGIYMRVCAMNEEVKREPQAPQLYLFYPNFHATIKEIILKCSFGGHFPDKTLLKNRVQFPSHHEESFHISTLPHLSGSLLYHTQTTAPFRPADQSAFSECRILVPASLPLAMLFSLPGISFSPFLPWDNAYLSLKNWLNFYLPS